MSRFLFVPVGPGLRDEARQILVDIANEHPLILTEPTPMATFEEFSDHSLSIVLRAFLPDLDIRLRTITELHTEIDKRFAAAGIEIPFPQRDLRIRSGADQIRGGS